MEISIEKEREDKRMADEDKKRTHKKEMARDRNREKSNIRLTEIEKKIQFKLE